VEATRSIILIQLEEVRFTSADRQNTLLVRDYMVFDGDPISRFDPDGPEYWNNANFSARPRGLRAFPQRARQDFGQPRSMGA